jgi:hypothetical protein
VFLVYHIIDLLFPSLVGGEPRDKRNKDPLDGIFTTHIGMQLDTILLTSTIWPPPVWGAWIETTVGAVTPFQGVKGATPQAGECGKDHSQKSVTGVKPICW